MGRGDLCRPSIKDTCVDKISLHCTEYWGKLPKETKLDDNGCITGNEVIEDIIDLVDKNTSDLDFSEFTGCIEYPKEGDVLTIKDIIKEHQERLCVIEEECCSSGNSGSGNTDCFDECGNEIGNGLVYYDTWVGDTELDSVLKDVSNGSIKYKTLKKGTYKVSVETYYTSAFSARIGISIDDSMPSGGVFNMTYNIGAVSPISTVFIADLNKGVNVTIKYSDTPASIGHSRVNMYKVVIEKVK